MAREETDQWLEKVFSASDPAALGHAYDEWAKDYEADMLAVGYMHPSVAAGLVGRHVRGLTGAILDAGVGTGLLGQILWIKGYRNLTGIDLSEGMLSRARDRGVYRDLRKRRLGEALDFPDAHFDCAVSIGTLNISHAPPESLDEFARITRPGGHVICTIPTKAWEEGRFGDKVGALERVGRWRALAATEPYRPMPFSLGEGDAPRACWSTKSCEPRNPVNWPDVDSPRINGATRWHRSPPGARARRSDLESLAL